MTSTQNEEADRSVSTRTFPRYPSCTNLRFRAPVPDCHGSAFSKGPARVREEEASYAFDKDGRNTRTRATVYNTLNQLSQVIGSAGVTAVTTSYSYDGNGNQTFIGAPLGRSTSKAFDSLNRLVQVTDPANGITGYAYDANNNLLSVTDPRSLVTSYAYDAFGDVVSRQSPDTGATSRTYDSAGNLLTSTDARGAVATYTYDALNRVGSIAYSLVGAVDQSVTFAYDAGANGIGHLTGASDSNHSLSWSYDSLGRVIGKSQTVLGVTKTVAYGYMAVILRL